ncbi:MAG: virulence factor [Anaerolineales bacterium]
MASVRIMFWKDIPYGVRAFDEGGNRVTRQLARRFEAAVDAAAMAEGATDEKAYRAGFRWSEPEERSGSAAEVVRDIVAEINAAYPPSRLAKLVRRRKAFEDR